ncbi:multisubunit sodium/proton antiporter MrpD subunit [Tepidamorphus gemmatus]|uniref:Multisubunit sodium/proton antiporter MrpD subunit n=1 Tax=Tepidamorphus gemmatus TaxID=747076 RepID=A0A4R3LUI8_9HYPH|nr:monovalent cation/H+ antiporter subunit D family protein [Tepidamorphus gemmatus]TCT04151.1 multisubunit sodium/proton antiporter MrpD subunit [Tepidamorphus gemmatus]
MIREQLPALQVVLPLCGAALCAFIDERRTAWLIATLTSFAMPVIAVLLLIQVLHGGPVSYAFGGWEPPFGIEYRVDVVNAFLLVLVSLIAAVVMPYARQSVAAEIPENKQAWFYCMYLLCLCGLLGMAITADAFNAFVFMEISSLSTYVLIAMGSDRRALVASYQYLILGTIGATFYVIGVGLLFSMTGTLNFGDLAERIATVEATRPILAALAFITVGLCLKLALFPLHVWLPNAYALAPSVATAFIAASATKVAIYLLLRFFFSIYGAHFVFDTLPVTPILLVLSIAAMFAASAVAIYQDNVKRMLAYSSVAQVGYITLGIALASQTGLTGGIAHLFNHALMKGALFLALGSIAYRVGNCGMSEMAGIGRRMPVTMAAFVIGGMSLVGVPGTVGFVSKWYLALGAIEQGWWWLAFLIVASSLLAVVYIGKVVEVAWFREPSAKAARIGEAPVTMIVCTWVLAAACIVFGIDAELTAGVAGRAAEALLAGLR